MRKMLRVRVSTKMYETLKNYASEQGIPVSIIVRIAIREYLKKEGII